MTCASLGDKHVTMHTLRHTAAMNLLAEGVDVSVIALWLGHQRTQSTDAYLHADMATPGRLYQRITAIDPAYRGRGIALALKLKTIEYGRAHGYSHIRTAVESNNPSMLAINRKLGFEQREGLALLERAL